MDDSSDSKPPWLVAPPPKVADRDDAQRYGDVKRASYEPRHDTGELVAPLNGGEHN